VPALIVWPVVNVSDVKLQVQLALKLVGQLVAVPAGGV
jgi:hypothetical protein